MSKSSIAVSSQDKFLFAAAMKTLGATPGLPDVPPLYLQAPDSQIAKGLNPFYVWRRAANTSQNYAAARMKVPRALYKQFESGYSLGLEEFRVQRFCDAMGITPHKLVGKEPISDGVRHAVLHQLNNGDANQRSDAWLALDGHCDDAEAALMLERVEQARKRNDLIVGFLDELVFTLPFSIDDMDPQQMLAERLAFHAQEQKRLKLLAVAPKQDGLYRIFTECVEHLYGEGNLRGVEANIRQILSSSLFFKPDKKHYRFNSLDAFGALIMRDPQLLGALAWQDAGEGRFVGDTWMTRQHAVRAMLDAHAARQARTVRENSNAFKVAVLEHDIDQLARWGKSNAGKRIMRFWQNRHEIAIALGQLRAPQRIQVSGLPAATFRPS